MHLKSKLCCRGFHITTDTHRLGFASILHVKTVGTVQWLESISQKNVIASLWISAGNGVFVDLFLRVSVRGSSLPEVCLEWQRQ